MKNIRKQITDNELTSLLEQNNIDVNKIQIDVQNIIKHSCNKICRCDYFYLGLNPCHNNCLDDGTIIINNIKLNNDDMRLLKLIQTRRIVLSNCRIPYPFVKNSIYIRAQIIYKNCLDITYNKIKNIHNDSQILFDDIEYVNKWAHLTNSIDLFHKTTHVSWLYYKSCVQKIINDFHIFIPELANIIATYV